MFILSIYTFICMFLSLFVSFEILPVDLFFGAVSPRRLIFYVSRPFLHHMIVFVLLLNFVSMFMRLLWVWSCGCVCESLPSDA